MSQIISQPRIAISGSDADSSSYQAMVKRVSEAGGLPVVIVDHGARDPHIDFKHIDALIIMGNDFDIDPIHYMHRYPDGDPRKIVHPLTRSELGCHKAKNRAKYEMTIMKLALKRQMPLLAICGGMHRLNVICGGTLHQHVPDLTGDDRLMQSNYQIPGEIPTRPVLIEPATRMSIIAKRIQMSFVRTKTPGLPTVIMENSFRHQSIDIIGEGLRVCALSDAIHNKDGTANYLIEAIEATPEGIYGNQFLIGVQWHPEFCASEIGKAIMKNLIKHALAYCA